MRKKKTNNSYNGNSNNKKSKICICYRRLIPDSVFSRRLVVFKVKKVKNKLTAVSAQFTDGLLDKIMLEPSIMETLYSPQFYERPHIV